VHKHRRAFLNFFLRVPVCAHLLPERENMSAALIQGFSPHVGKFTIRSLKQKILSRNISFAAKTV
jgi:hypothetical protein